MMEGRAGEAMCAMLITKSNFLFARVSELGSVYVAAQSSFVPLVSKPDNGKNWRRLEARCRSMAEDFPNSNCWSDKEPGREARYIEMYGSKKQRLFEDTTRTASTVVVPR